MDAEKFTEARQVRAELGARDSFWFVHATAFKRTQIKQTSVQREKRLFETVITLLHCEPYRKKRTAPWATFLAVSRKNLDQAAVLPPPSQYEGFKKLAELACTVEIGARCPCENVQIFAMDISHRRVEN